MLSVFLPTCVGKNISCVQTRDQQDFTIAPLLVSLFFFKSSCLVSLVCEAVDLTVVVLMHCPFYVYVISPESTWSNKARFFFLGKQGLSAVRQCLIKRVPMINNLF